jgi:hydroxymethylglutaryl-CoA lyase
MNDDQLSTNNYQLKLIECPRDAMQGLKEYIPAEVKADYINALLRVGFDTIDFGSFVSPAAIPQMRDTAEVISRLYMTNTSSKLLAIIANLRGAEMAVSFDEITYLGFPHALSPKFLSLNINSNPEKALRTINEINNLLNRTSYIINRKSLVVYLSLAFGNPYGELWNLDLVNKGVESLVDLGVNTIILADTLGDGTSQTISDVFKNIIPAFPNIEFGFHLHTENSGWYEKVDAAYTNGCRRFDSVMLGFGGCPMSTMKLVGNLSTENLIDYFNSKNINLSINKDRYQTAIEMADKIFLG